MGAAIAWSYDKTGYPRAPSSAVPVPGSPEAAAAEFAAEETDKSVELTPEHTPFVLLAHVKVHEELLADHMEYAETIDGIVRDSEPGMLYQISVRWKLLNPAYRSGWPPLEGCRSCLSR